jgi:hypothetical protein
MKHFYKLPINMPNIPLMTEIMRNRAELFDNHGLSVKVPEDGKRMALGILQMTNGSALLEIPILQWLPHGSKYVWHEADGNHYIIMLNGQVMCMVDDECPPMNTAEVWWVDGKNDAIFINKSGDDAVLLHVFVKVE